jgi:hypothetical protein
MGGVHDLCPRDHTGKLLREPVAKVAEPLHVHGPWKSTRSAVDPEPAVTAAVSKMAMQPVLAIARRVYPSQLDRFRAANQGLAVHGMPA